jgi:hypothetical protein
MVHHSSFGFSPANGACSQIIGSATSPVDLTSNVACRSFKSIWSTKISRHVEANCLSPRLTTEQNQTQYDHRLLGFRRARCGQNLRHTYELGRECAERRFSRNVFCVFDLWADRSAIAAACSHNGGRWARLCRTDREPTTCRDRGVRSQAREPRDARKGPPAARRAMLMPGRLLSHLRAPLASPSLIVSGRQVVRCHARSPRPAIQMQSASDCERGCFRRLSPTWLAPADVLADIARREGS